MTTEIELNLTTDSSPEYLYQFIGEYDESRDTITDVLTFGCAKKGWCAPESSDWRDESPVLFQPYRVEIGPLFLVNTPGSIYLYFVKGHEAILIRGDVVNWFTDNIDLIERLGTKERILDYVSI